MIAIKNITAVILAGGRATRMDGQDKGLLTLNGKTFVERIAEQFSRQVDHTIINANRNIPQYQQTGLQVVEDNLSDFQGPLAGMLAALDTVKTDWIITAPCDGPFIEKHYVENMFRAVQSQNTQLAVATDGEWLQPVYALIHRDMRSSLVEFLTSGERKIDRWYKQHKFAQVVFSSKGKNNMFTNVNTPEQLTELERR